MKTFTVVRTGVLLLISSLAVSARELPLRYKFALDQTNVFAVEMSVTSETGTEITSGNVILVTKAITTNSVKLACRGNFKSEMKRTSHGNPMFYGGYGYYPGGMMPNASVFPNDCEIELNDRGIELRDGGDYVMAVPLGKLVQSLFEPLPGKPGNLETSDTVTVLDDPFWLGPADFFSNTRMNGRPMTMPFNMAYPQQSVSGLAVAREITIREKSLPGELLSWHKTMTLQSLSQTGGEPRLVASSETDATFDRSAGRFTNILTHGEVTSQTETTSRKAHVTFKARLLTGDELAAALAPPPPPTAPRVLTADDLAQISTDLKSPDLETRRAAIRRFNGANVDNPSAEFTTLVAAMALDSDSFVQMTAANFLGEHATTNEVPLLIKLLKNTDWSSRQAATKALGRLKDERAIEPLTDLIARNGNSYGQDAATALINIGAPAEKAVIELLHERNMDTQRQACNILEQIGTKDSLEALQALVGSGDQQTSQSAVEAIRAIKQRE